MHVRHSYLLILIAAMGTLLVSPPADSDPLFQANSIHYVSGIFPYGSAAGDFDGDGHLDFALVVVTTPAFQTARGHGDGRFDAIQSSPALALGAPVAADLDGDGLADVLVSGGGLSIRYGSPGTGLGPENLLSGASFSQHAAVGDVNGDGRPDLVTAQGTTLIVRLATAPRAYAADLPSPTGAAADLYNVVLGDIDEDSKLDVLLATTAGEVAWMKGHGDGTFDPEVPLQTSDGELFLADLNGDHHLDVVGSEAWTPGDGHGGFGPTVDLGATVGAPLGRELYVSGVADMTGDGSPDLVVYSIPLVADGSLQNDATFELFRNDGSGNFSRSFSKPLMQFSFATIADFNEDGRLDVLAPDGVIGNVSVHLSNGDGTFGNGLHFPTGNHPSGVALAEITGDARLDVVTSNLFDATISVLPGLAGGVFGPPVAYAVDAGPSGIAVGDLNGDGRSDVVTANGSGTVSVLLGQPGGGLGSATSTLAGTGPAAVALGDIDRDGHLDAVVANEVSGTVQVLEGDGSGALTPGASYGASIQPASLAIADLNGDAWPDVVENTGRPSDKPNFVDVFLNNGSGGLLPKVSYSSGGRAVAIAEVTGDGVPDVISVGKVFVQVLRGIGGGALSPMPSFRVSQNRAVALGDADSDGKLDLFIAGDLANCAWVARGLGGGVFAPAEGYGTERGPSGIAVADLDGDGALDVVTSDGDTNQVSVLLATHAAPVPALATLVSAQATASGAHIEWLTGGGWRASVERSENGAPWMPVGQILADGSGRLVFEDPDVTRGADYAYRLGFDQDGRTIYAGLVSLHVPVTTSLALAASPNPAQGAFGVWFTLPDARPARLELYDVSGRRLLAREVGAMGAGAHVLRLEETSRLASGLYWLRLVHPQQTLVARAAIVR